MGIFLEISETVNRAENLAEGLIADIDEITTTLLSEMEGPGIRLGLGPQRNTNRTPAREGDIVLRVEVDGTLTPFIISNTDDEKPLARNTKQGEEIAIEPELLVIGALTKNPALKRAAGRLATKYPDRKVFLYGDTKMKMPEEQPQVQ